jgi:hypothetical protein
MHSSLPDFHTFMTHAFLTGQIFRNVASNPLSNHDHMISTQLPTPNYLVTWIGTVEQEGTKPETEHHYPKPLGEEPMTNVKR